MAISAAQVKELRDKTGAGMMDCKKALTESDGDFEKAIEILRKKGASVAAKRAERAANEGIVLTSISDDKKTGYIVEVNCETDFVAKSDDFVNFANNVLKAFVDHPVESVGELFKVEFDGRAIGDRLTDAIGKIGEKIEVSRIAKVTSENGIVVDYIHHGSKLGVMLVAENVPSESADEFANLMKDIAMQIAAMNPLYLNRDEVPEDAINKELDIYKEIARKEGKPDQIIDRIAEGKLKKYYEENCLIEQAFVKDNAKKVGDLIDEFNKTHSSEASLKLFKRFHLSDENK
ncbi:MAG: elongation factor Ts [Chlorobi bacterium]|nr:elongation factor Ts [Chlorobiota bacterium]